MQAKQPKPVTPQQPKNGGVKVRGTGAAVKGTKARGPMA